MNRMGSYGHQGGQEVPLASSRAYFGPIGSRLKNRLLEMGLKGFTPPAGTDILGVVLDRPDGFLRAPGSHGGASGVLAGLFWPHRRTVERTTSGDGAKGL